MKKVRNRNTFKDTKRDFSSFGGEEYRAIVESTAGCYWLDVVLTYLGNQLLHAHPKCPRAISYAKVKIDQTDAHALAQILRMNHSPVAPKIRAELRAVRRGTFSSVKDLIPKIGHCVQEDRIHSSSVGWTAITESDLVIIRKTCSTYFGDSAVVTG